jgi:hypothetical protein
MLVEDEIVDTIGITDTTGNMGVLGRKLRENGQEHAYCTDHNFHLNAKLAFDGLLFTFMYFLECIAYVELIVPCFSLRQKCT